MDGDMSLRHSQQDTAGKTTFFPRIEYKGENILGFRLTDVNNSKTCSNSSNRAITSSQ